MSVRSSAARHGAVAVLAALLVGPLAAQTPPAPPSVADEANRYAAPAALSQVQVSPNGKRLAMLVAAPNGRLVAAVLDLPPQGAARVVGGFNDVDVVTVRWVNDDRLYYSATAADSLDFVGATIAVDHDGNSRRELINYQWDGGFAAAENSRLPTVKSLPLGWYVVGTLHDGSDDIVVGQGSWRANGDFVETRVARLNTRTGQIDTLSRGSPDHAARRVYDAKGQLTVVLSVNDGRARLHFREAEDRWVVLEDHEQFSDDVLVPEMLESDGQLIVSTRRGHDTVGLYSYDLKTRKLDPQPLVRLARFDITPDLEPDLKLGRVVGAHLTTDGPQSVWFSDRLAAVQKAVDAALPPGRFNRIYCGHCETTPFFIIRSSSDRHPGEYLLFDLGKRSLSKLGEARPWIDPAREGSRSFHRVDARDGLSLPVVLTHPAGQATPAALPAVVLVHGGPHVRGGSRAWSREAQFLARRGYRVIEVEFRGSKGFGARHLRAGFKQWGLAMQDDLADAVKWAAREGWVDPARVCIVGASYGGYAALMGPVRDPGLYRCAASHVGVTDLQLLFTSARDDLTEQGRKYTMPTLVGDPKADAERLRTTSPVERVAEIKVPVFLAQGLLDRRVPKEHADRFESAARRAGVSVERVDYPSEGHGFAQSRNLADFLVRLDAFLARSLKP
jgi:dipeptidyl aminopeptidase/acylaminoacyl peptidase